MDAAERISRLEQHIEELSAQLRRQQDLIDSIHPAVLPPAAADRAAPVAHVSPSRLVPNRRELLRLAGVTAVGAAGLAALRPQAASAATNVLDDGSGNEWIYGQINLGSASGLQRIGYPSDGSNQVVFYMQSANLSRGPIVASVADDLFAASREPTIYWGYNLYADGSQVLPGEPGWAWGLESYYDDGSGHIKMESYLHYVTANGSKYIRPIMFQMDRSTDQVSGAFIQGQRINLNYNDGSNTGANMASFLPSITVLYAPATGTNVLDIRAAQGGSSIVKLGSNGVRATTQLATDPNNAALFNVSVNSAPDGSGSQLPVLYASGAARGIKSNPAVSFGTLDTAAVMTAVNSGAPDQKVLVGRGSASQKGNLLELQASSGALLVQADPSGNITTAGKITAKGAAVTITGSRGNNQALAALLTALANLGLIVDQTTK